MKMINENGTPPSSPLTLDRQWEQNDTLSRKLNQGQIAGGTRSENHREESPYRKSNTNSGKR